MAACGRQSSIWKASACKGSDRQAFANIANTRCHEQRNGNNVSLVKNTSFACTRPRDLPKKTNEVQPITPEPMEIEDAQHSKALSDSFNSEDYVANVFHYLKELEAKHPIRAHFLDSRYDLTSKHRAIVVDWMHQVVRELRLNIDTFYRAVYFLDAFLQAQIIRKEYLQLTGVAATFLAAKYEESDYPSVQDLIYLAGSSVTKSQVLRLEVRMLKVLNFELGRPQADAFLELYTGISDDERELAKFFLEVAAHSYKLAHVQPSLIALSAADLSRLVLNTSNQSVVCDSHYQEKQVRDVTITLSNVAIRVWKSDLYSLKNKYSGSWNGVAFIQTVQDTLQTIISKK